MRFSREPTRKSLTNLVNQQKKIIKSMREEYFKSLRERLDQEAGTTIEFINRSQHLQKEPYMFVSGKGIILGYTPALEVALGITEDIKGKYYLDIFSFEDKNPETKERLQKYFSSKREMEIPYSRKDGRKTRHLIITKEKPIYIEKIDLGLFRPGKTINAVAFVPIRVSAKKRTIKDLFKTSSCDFNEAVIDLIVYHGFNSEQIQKITEKDGKNGLIKECRKLENNSK